MFLVDDLMDIGRQGFENVEEFVDGESKLFEVKFQSFDQKIFECLDVLLFKNSEFLIKSIKSFSNVEFLSKNVKSFNKSEGKELNDVKLFNYVFKEGKDYIILVNLVKVMFGKGSDSVNQKKIVDVFDFREEEEEVLDKFKFRYGIEKESSQKLKKVLDFSKISFKWDINDIILKDIKFLFESKMINKMVNYK